jgi:hypothetical protein
MEHFDEIRRQRKMELAIWRQASSTLCGISKQKKAEPDRA